MNVFTEFCEAISATYPFPPYGQDWREQNEWYSKSFRPHENVDYDSNGTVGGLCGVSHCGP